jgi:mono/diheme cytochrome c family protein
MLLGLCMLLSACRYDMQDQPKYKPLGRSTFFPDGRMSRPVPAGTIARDELSDKDTVHTGNADGSFVPTIPVPVTKALLERGHDRFDIYCSPCHARTGDGNGMIHQRGFWIPSNLHTERLRSVPPGYLYQVIANGYGAMPDYRDQVPVEDRWAIVAYLRALQLSRHATLADVPQDVRQQLESKGAAPQGTRP